MLFLYSFIGLLLVAISKSAREVELFSINVALTTIPPRFQSLHHTVRSVLTQEFPVNSVYIFIPAVYRRFRRKHRANSPTLPHVDTLVQYLQRHEDIMPWLANNTIKVVSIEKDWGPISRLSGVVSEYVRSCDGQSCTNRISMYPAINGEEGTQYSHTNDLLLYWLFCDDDVGYEATLTKRYVRSLLDYHQSMPAHHANSTSHVRSSLGLTQFAETYRMTLPTFVASPDSQQSLLMTLIPHIQGVDTYLVSDAFFVQQQLSSSNNNRDTSFAPFHSERFFHILATIHEHCPYSFFQDDYVSAALFHAAGVRFRSIWANDIKLVEHIEGVSKSNFQMHMDDQVFNREQSTRECLPSLFVHLYAASRNEVKSVDSEREDPVLEPVL